MVRAVSKMELAKRQYEDAKLESDNAFSSWLAISMELSAIKDAEEKRECQRKLKDAFVILRDKNKTKSNAASNLSTVKTEELEKRAKGSKLNKVTEKDSEGERMCKDIVEKLTGKKFVKVRPSFLFNYITGRNLELDMHNEELKLAIEFNGEHHYKYTPYFHKNKEAYYCGRYRDYMKRIMCEKEGITLISVSYEEENIEKYLSSKLLNFI